MCYVLLEWFFCKWNLINYTKKKKHQTGFLIISISTCSSSHLLKYVLFIMRSIWLIETNADAK